MLRDGRELRIDSLPASLDDSVKHSRSHSRSRSHVVLVPAFNEVELEQVTSLLGELIALGCKELCCVGPEAELLHDTLDEILVQQGFIEVVTTWHTDYLDACEYFLLAAGGREGALLALIAAHPELVALIEHGVWERE
jgi:hypothetical protein